ncbi:GNAT family N-acetyltransferase [Nocardia wallacei]|uniref:GNAT family N-acetyltransferase n=1 Tax=Nocardia wallacei TaxID=480035 RepID=UPI002457A10F|nr:GNAT family N-acetyltransferase [Nocardia wallacei]
MGEGEQVTVVVGSAVEARRQMDAVCALYDEVFSVPPFVWPDGESVRHRQMLDRLVLDPTFGTAFATIAGELVGFVYGIALKPDTNWWNGFREPVADDMTREWTGRTFAVIDLAVRNDWRRKGIGRRLLGTLLSTRPEERTTLAVQPQAAGSHAFYAAIGGWQLVGRQDTPSYVSSQFDIYVADLPGAAKP